MENQYKYTVCIHCMTYNHKPYILDALHGFTMQQTNFPYVALVMDDASTDGEPEVLRQYIDEQCDTSSMITIDDELYELVEINAKDNPNCHFAFYFLKQNLYGTGKKKPIIDEWDAKVKYIACCEGDDYWTDPLKLQKQVDFLESHPDYSMCFTKVEVLSDVVSERHLFDHLVERDYAAADFYGRWAISTCTIMYRKDSYLQNFRASSQVVFGDMYLFLLMSEMGKIRCLGFKGSVYRKQSRGISSGQSHDLFARLSKQYRWYIKRFGYNDKLKQLSIRQESDYISYIMNDIAYKDTWKYRFRYISLHPKLLFSKYLLVTIVKYMLFRPFYLSFSKQNHK